MEKRKIKDEDYIRKKIRKLERKLGRLREEENTEDEYPLPPHMSAPQTPPPHSPSPLHVPVSPLPLASAPAPGEADPIIDEDQLPEEFLLALGNEGEEKSDIGEAIRPELALRWSRIMTNGLGKEARDLICNKYPTPGNFLNAKAPVMNPEMLASFSELTQKRDKRICQRQNLTGKLMTCLGKSLTNLLKGNINSKILIEEINDAAKLAADIYNQDSSSRKFFALSGASQVIKEAVKEAKTDEFLFGKDCGDKIKSAQAIQKTGAQIKASTGPKPNQKLTTKPKVGNWKGPPQQQQQHRARGGHRQQRRQPYNQSHRKHQATRSRNNYRR